MERIKYQIRAKNILTPYEILKDAIITVENDFIKAINDENKNIVTFNLGKKNIVPGLINAHDHLLGNYYPRIGKGPYINWLPWDNDLKSSPIYTERSKIPPKEIYLLAAYRNLISGVLTVSDHIPHFVNDPYVNQLPIRVIKNYTLAHESSDYDLQWGEGIEIEYKRAVEKRYPFITHIEEGYDKESERGIDKLRRLKALGKYTVLIHAIALSDKDIRTIAHKKANIVWCPNSNMFMFNRTGNVKKWIEHNINVSLGTDSPMSGGINLLDEIQFANQTYRKLYNEDIDPQHLMYMVTCNPARAFNVHNITGSIHAKKLADLVVLNGDTREPYRSFVETRLEDIALVIYRGRPIYGDEEYRPIFEYLKVNTSQFKINQKEKLCIGDPLSLLHRIRKLVKFDKYLPFLPIE